MFKWLIGMMCTLTAVQAFASAIVVEGVQMPAWVERNGQKVPLKVGTKLNSTDLLHTGPNARILLKLSEGSRIKLGENGSLHLDEVSAKKTFFSAALEVVKGAFRFSTAHIIKHRRRDVDVRIGSATIGIRGTDVWGKAADDKDIVCLLEGKISVDRGTEPQVIMQDPLTFYIAPKGKPAEMIAPVPPEQIAEWAKETEIQPAQGSARLGGKWKVYLLATPSESEALQAYDTLSHAGYAAEIRPVTISDATEYRVRIANLPSKKEGEALADRLKGQAGIDKTWVSIK